MSTHVFQTYSGGMGCSCQRCEPHDKLQVVSGKQTNNQSIKQTNKQTVVIYSLKHQKAKDHNFFPDHSLHKFLNGFGILAREF